GGADVTVPSMGAETIVTRAFTVPSTLVWPVNAGKMATTAPGSRTIPPVTRTKRLFQIAIVILVKFNPLHFVGESIVPAWTERSLSKIAHSSQPHSVQLPQPVVAGSLYRQGREVGRHARSG